MKKECAIPMNKNKGDAQCCRSFRGIKLMSHTMKIWERIIEARLRDSVEISKQQYGFMLVNGNYRCHVCLNPFTTKSFFKFVIKLLSISLSLLSLQSSLSGKNDSEEASSLLLSNTKLLGSVRPIF